MAFGIRGGMLGPAATTNRLAERAEYTMKIVALISIAKIASAGPNLQLSICFVGLVLLTAGCRIWHHTEVPGGFGRVVDAQTRLPLENMRATVIPVTSYANRSHVARTATDGIFTLPPYRTWWAGLFPLHLDWRRYELCVWHSSAYEPFTNSFSHWVNGRPIINFGEIRLRPAALAGESHSAYEAQFSQRHQFSPYAPQTSTHHTAP